MHSTLCRAFADTPADNERVLFRIEQNTEDGFVRVLVQSHAAPDFSKLPVGYCAEPPQTRGDYGEKLAALTTGQTLHFRLRANPTIKRQGKRLGLREPAEQQAWLERKLREAGAELVDCRFMPHDVTQARKHNAAAENAPRQIHLAVLFEGTLRVADSAQFVQAAANGLGAAKGYGFGLLSIAPA